MSMLRGLLANKIGYCAATKCSEVNSQPCSFTGSVVVEVSKCSGVFAIAKRMLKGL